MGLPTPWDQQWSLRIQQVLAFESDLLEYGDLFEGSVVVERKVASLCEEAAVELQWVLDGGGSFAMIDEMKGRLVQSHAERVRRIESGELKVVGVNSFTETAPSPLAEVAQNGGIVTIDPALEAEHVRAIAAWRAAREPDARSTPPSTHLRAVAATTGEPRARDDRAREGGRNGRRVGRRAARGVRRIPGADRRRRGRGAARAPRWKRCASGCGRSPRRPGRPIRLLVGKPGLDGHSNGAEQIAVAARDAGFEVIYQGIRLTPAEIAAAARDEDVDVVGLSILSGSHLGLVPEILRLLREAGVDAPGRGRRDHSRTPTARSSRRWAWPGCTRRRITASRS